MEDVIYLIPEESSDAIITDVAKFREIESNLRNIFTKHECKEVLLPSFEYVDLYQYVNYATHNENMFQYINHEGKTVAMRLDFTIPLARLYARSKIQTMAKYSYFGKVYRKEVLHKGRSSEFYQAGVEWMNHPGKSGDLDCLSLVLEVRKQLQLKNVIIEIGSAKFFKRICELVGNKKDELTKILTFRDISHMKQFVLENNFSEGLNQFLLKLPTLFGDLKMLDDVLAILKDKELLASLEELKDVYLKLDDTSEIIFDLGMVPSMSYYTGLMIKGYSDQCAKPIISGGRYDDLLPKFDVDASAIGFCCHMNYILEALSKEGERND